MDICENFIINDLFIKQIYKTMIFREKIEKIIERKIKKSMSKSRKNGKDITYSFWWFLGKNIQDKDNLKDVCRAMSEYYRQHQNLFLMSQINELIVVGNTIFIYTGRPGIIIGKTGRCIDELERTINYDYYGGVRFVNHYYKISLIEDMVSGIKNITRNI